MPKFHHSLENQHPRTRQQLGKQGAEWGIKCLQSLGTQNSILHPLWRFLSQRYSRLTLLQDFFKDSWSKSVLAAATFLSSIPCFLSLRMQSPPCLKLTKSISLDLYDQYSNVVLQWSHSSCTDNSSNTDYNRSPSCRQLLKGRDRESGQPML